MGARVDAAGAVSWAHGRFAELLASADEPDAVVAVDIPVGLPEDGRRACDLAGRAALGAAASRLFLTPPRAALLAPDLASANALLRAAGRPGVSAQTFALRRAVLEVDAHRDDPRVVEVHPELSFLAATGRVLAPKRTARGVGERVAALRGFVDVADALAGAPPGVPADDALDALAAAWTARRVQHGMALRYPGGPDHEPAILA